MADDLSTDIDFVTDGEYADHDEVKVVMTRTQLKELANTIAWNVDIKTVKLDKAEPDRAEFLIRFRDGAREALGMPSS